VRQPCELLYTCYLRTLTRGRRPRGGKCSVAVARGPVVQPQVLQPRRVRVVTVCARHCTAAARRWKLASCRAISNAPVINLQRAESLTPRNVSACVVCAFLLRPRTMYVYVFGSKMNDQEMPDHVCCLLYSSLITTKLSKPHCVSIAVTNYCTWHLPYFLFICKLILSRLTLDN